MKNTDLFNEQESRKVFSDLMACAKTWDHAGIPTEVSWVVAIAYFKEMIEKNYPEGVARDMIQMALTTMERARS